MQRLTGKVAIVTGGARGISKGVGELISEAHVVLLTCLMQKPRPWRTKS